MTVCTLEQKAPDIALSGDRRLPAIGRGHPLVDQVPTAVSEAFLEEFEPVNAVDPKVPKILAQLAPADHQPDRPEEGQAQRPDGAFALAAGQVVIGRSPPCGTP